MCYSLYTIKDFIISKKIGKKKKYKIGNKRMKFTKEKIVEKQDNRYRSSFDFLL
jgi:hypothetical protein